jgi:predicted nucleotide-binding protein (sugar kinase/HSP70/actin superfamily)
MIHCENPEFLDFVKKHLLYHKIIGISQYGDNQTAELILDNGTILIVQGNEGCGGCRTGWYYLTHLAGCDNAIMNVELVTDNLEEKYSLYVMTEDKRLNVLTYEGYDNGYYGVGFYITVKEKK